MMDNHGKVGENVFVTICCDIEVMRRVLVMTSKEQIGHEVVVDWVKLGVMGHHLPS